MAARMSIDIPEQSLVEIGRVLEERVPGRPVFVFGSRVTGLARPDSDLDLAIGGNCPLTLSDRGLLRDALEKIGLGFQVDIIDLQDARGIFRKRIETEWIPLEQAKARRALATV